MIKTKALPIILRVTSKIEVKPIIERLKSLDLKSLDNGGKLSKEEAAILFFEMIAEITPQLGKIEDDIVPLIAVLKDVSEDEAKELSIFDVFNELASDKELVSFFKRALMNGQG